MDCSPPGSSVHGISQARMLEWVAISFSRGSSQPRDWKQVGSSLLSHQRGPNVRIIFSLKISLIFSLISLMIKELRFLNLEIFQVEILHLFS